jgi:hypothetical protein
MATQKVSDVLIETFPSSKLTGAMPALDGSAITGAGDPVTKSASDPVITTNPSGGVSHIWVNTTSGEMFVCTDATTDNNVWTNVGAGSGDIQTYIFGGTVSGYTSGGYRDGPANFNGIYKFSFASGVQNAAQIGIITVARHQGASQSSKSHGYTSGGGPIASSGANVIDKFTFATDNDATDVGDTLTAIQYTSGNSSSNHGYICGNSPGTNVIQKFTFAVDADSTDVANLSSARENNAGQNASAYGYAVHGNSSINIIDKYPYASDSDATDIGNLAFPRGAASGQSSETHGYTSGGSGGPGGNEIDKFSFATDGNATSVGVLTRANNNMAGQSSRTFGYSCGGDGGWTNVMDKFTFASDNDATDVGDLPAEKGYFHGHNY